MLRSIIDAANGARSCGIIGSIDTYDGVEDIESTNTTPEAPDLWRHLANARDAQLAAMVMEVSSQALKYDRTLGVELDVAAFLNIGSDHISPVEHPTFEDYFASKLRIFSQCRRAVVNLGTNNVERVLDAAHSGGEASEPPELVCVSAAGPDAIECGSCDMVYPDIWATDIKPLGTQLTFVAHGTEAPEEDGERVEWQLPVTINFPGLFNVENALVAIACAKLLGVNDAAIVAGLAACRVPGRMELYPSVSGKILGVVDFAHNGMSLETLLRDLRENYPERELAVVFGATGGKGVDRRTTMGIAAGKYADRIVITEDDPGPEDVEDICAEIARNVQAQGNDNWQIVTDRVAAIETAVRETVRPAVVIVTGKGEEERMLRKNGPEPCERDGSILKRTLAAYDA